MTRTRTIGTLAAIGGLTATVALLTGFPAANADELADLRANQELLQRRIDQLAQGAIPPSKFRRVLPRPWAPTDPGASDHRRQLSAVVPDPGHRHLDPRRRLHRHHRELPFSGRQHRELVSPPRMSARTAI